VSPVFCIRDTFEHRVLRMCLLLSVFASAVVVLISCSSKDPISAPTSKPQSYSNEDFFVSKVSGDDRNRGTRTAPFKSLQAAIDAAAAKGGNVRVAAGAYNETITLASGVNLWGGYADGSFDRNIGSNLTTIIGGFTAINGAGVDSVTVDGFTVVSGDVPSGEPGKSSVAIHLHDCTGILISNNVVTAGSVTAGGVLGTGGRDGSNGAGGADGSGGGKGGFGSIGSIADGVAGSSGGGVGAARVEPVEGAVCRGETDRGAATGDRCTWERRRQR
jgi:hypothetical protein